MALSVSLWACLGAAALGIASGATQAQVRPGVVEIAAYTGLHAAAASGDVARIQSLLAGGADPHARDGHGRTALHVAAFARQGAVMRALVAGGADPDVLENDRYDIVTIAAVAGDVPTLETALALGASPANVTSIYDGTALIAAAHLGHVEVVQTLIAAGAPLDHVNNLHWTAVIESIVLGDGGPNHLATLAALVEAGARLDLADGNGRTPLALARTHGHAEMVTLLEAAGAP